MRRAERGPATPLSESVGRREQAVSEVDDGEGPEALTRLYDRSSAIAACEGVKVEPVPELPGEMLGYYAPLTRRIVLREAAPRQVTKTLAQEPMKMTTCAEQSNLV